MKSLFRHRNSLPQLRFRKMPLSRAIRVRSGLSAERSDRGLLPGAVSTKTLQETMVEWDLGWAGLTGRVHVGEGILTGVFTNLE